MPAHRRHPGWLLGSIGLWGALLLHPALPGKCAEPRPPNLQGSWNLNVDLTARLSGDQQAREGDAGGGHRGGLGGLGPIGGDHTDPALGDWSPGKERHEAEVRREVVAYLDRLIIVQQPGLITITDQSGHARVLKTDGSKLRDQGPAGATQLRASWDRDGSLVVEVKPDKGTRRTESYLVSNDGKHLYLTVTISGQQGQVVRAYDPVPAPAAAAPATGATPATPAQDLKPPR